MTSSKYRYLGPYGFLNVLGQAMYIGDVAELDDEFIAKIGTRSWKFEPVASEPVTDKPVVEKPVATEAEGEATAD